MVTQPETYVFKKVGELELKADVYTPSDAVGTLPGLVEIHGGALIGGSRSGVSAGQRQMYLDAGFLVISIDYRLAPETKIPGIIEDLTDAFCWIRKSGPGLNLDPERLGVMGHSAGGYLSLMAGFAVEPTPQAVVAFYGYGDIIGDWYSKPDPFYLKQPLVMAEDCGFGVPGPETVSGYEGRNKNGFYLYCRQHGIWPNEVGGVDPALDGEFFVPFCPARNVTAAYPPTLLLHGTADTDVTYDQSELMAVEFKKFGVEHELITMEGHGHGFDNNLEHPEVQKALNKVLEFLKQHV